MGGLLRLRGPYISDKVIKLLQEVGIRGPATSGFNSNQTPPLAGAEESTHLVTLFHQISRFIHVIVYKHCTIMSRISIQMRMYLTFEVSCDLA